MRTCIHAYTHPPSAQLKLEPIDSLLISERCTLTNLCEMIDTLTAVPLGHRLFHLSETCACENEYVQLGPLSLVLLRGSLPILAQVLTRNGSPHVCWIVLFIQDFYFIPVILLKQYSMTSSLL